MATIDLSKVRLNLGAYSDHGVDLLNKAYYENTTPKDYNADYGFTDWAADMWSDMYRNVQTGEMQEAQDRMAVNKQNIEDSQELLDLFDRKGGEGGDDMQQEIDAAINETITRMRRNGSWSSIDQPTDSDLQSIISQNSKEYEQNQNDYYHNLDQLNSSYGSHDISQYYTRRSNEAVMSWGNWFYKMPSTMGTSNTSPFLQTSSMAAGAAGFKIGAAIGSSIGPEGTAAGAVAGAIAGGILSLAGSQFLGGMQSRENESHMEAINAYSENVTALAQQAGVDLGKVADNVRDQLIKQGRDISHLDNNQLVQIALSDKDVVSGSIEFDKIAKDAYRGTRRVYEQNNALGAGEALSDMSYFIPLGKWTKGVAKAAGKAVVANTLGKAFAKRAAAGLKMANFGNKLRNKVILDKFTNFLVGSAERSIIEGTEEGAQHMIVDKYKNGQYDDDYANSSFLDALKDGQIAEDLWDNLVLRAKSASAAMGLNSEYQHDQQLFEEMLGGALLPFMSPQGFVGSASNIVSTVKEISNSKVVGDYIAQALLTQDGINRNEQYYKFLREGVGSGTYAALTDRVQSMLKEKGLDGKTRKYNLDTTVLTDDGSTPTDLDIDAFFLGQKIQQAALDKHKSTMQPVLDSMKLEKPEDEDLLLALSYNARIDRGAAASVEKKADNTVANDAKTLATDAEFRKSVNDIFGKLKKRKTDESEQTAENTESENALSEYAYEAIASLFVNRYTGDWFDTHMQQAEAEAAIKTILAEKGVTSPESLIDLTKAIECSISLSNSRKEEDGSTVANLAKALNVDPSDINLALDAISISPEHVAALQKDATKFAKTQLVSALMEQKAEVFTNKDSKYNNLRTEYIQKYRDMVKKQDQLAQQVADVARTQTAEGEEKAAVGVETGVTPAYTDLTKTNVTQLTQDLIEQARKENLDSAQLAVTELDSLLAAVPEDSVFRGLVDEVNKGKALVQSNPISYARYLTNVINRLKWDYQRKAKDESVSDEDKAKLNKVLEVAEGLTTKLNNIVKLDVEARAKAQVYKPALESESRIWTDEAGNRYQFDMNKAEYSENDGLVLTMHQIFDDDMDASVKDAFTRLDKTIELANKDTEVNPDNKDRNDKIIETANKIKETLQKTQEDKKKHEIKLRADDPFLQLLTTLTNKNVSKSFADTVLPGLTKTISNLIESHKHSRHERAEMAAADGDTFEFRMGDERDKVHSPSRQDPLAPAEGSSQVQVKGYPLGGDSPIAKSIAAMLGNPYYQAKAWHGYITAPYDNAAQVKADLGDDKAIVSFAGKRLNRYKAVEKFHLIGQAILKLREKNGDIDAVIRDLEQLADGKTQSVKIGDVTVSKDDYDNIVWALPTRIYLNQARVGKKWSWLVTPDFASANRTTKPGPAEIDSRVTLIHNLLLKYKKVEKDDQNDQGGADVGEDTGSPYRSRVYFGENSAQVVFGGYNYEETTVRNKESNVFQNENGQVMSNAEINKHYDEASSRALPAFLEKIDDLVTLLNEMGYEVTADDLAEQMPTREKKDDEKSEEGEDQGEPETKLQHLIKGIAKYGDGTIDVSKTFIPRYVVHAVGPARNTRSIKDANLARAVKLLRFARSVAPDMFLTYKNFQDDNKLTPPVDTSVENAIENHWFAAKKAVKIYTEGEEVIPSKENAGAILDMMKTFERLIRESKNSNEFWNALTDLGYSFALDNSSEKAEQLLRDYFDNRRFSMLDTPTNIVQAITMGTTTPMNSSVNYEKFDRVSKHVNNKLTKIKALGLQKDEDGVYHFSLKKWLAFNTSDEDIQENFKKEEADQRKQLEIERDGYLKEIDGLKQKKSLVDYIIDPSHTAFFDAEFVDANTNVDSKDPSKIVLKHTATLTRALLRSRIKEMYDGKIDAAAKELEKKRLETAKEEAQFDDSEEQVISFGFGSYKTDGSADIVYYDKNGVKHVVSNAKGTPGAVYMVLPAFLNPNRTKSVVHLNPAHISLEQARVIAGIMRDIAAGTYRADQFVGEIEVDGFKVKSNATFQELLDSLIYTGTDAIANNPSEANYARLLNIENGQVQFGADTLNDTNFESLVQFIVDNKTYRIDRQKFISPYSTFGIDLEIKDAEGNFVFSHKADDNYTSYMIDDGIVMTDLSTQGRLFKTPNVYVNYNQATSFTSTATREQVVGTAANAKAAIKGEEINKDELLEDLGKSSAKQEAKMGSYVENYVKSFNKKVSELAMAGKLKPGKYKIGIYSNVSSTIKITYDASIAVNNETGNLQLAAVDSQGLRAQLLNSANFHYDHRLALLDEKGEWIKVDGKAVMYGGGFKNVTFTDFDTNKKQTTPANAPATVSSDQSGESVEELRRRLAYEEGRNAGLTMALQQGVTPGAQAVPVTAQPYVPGQPQQGAPQQTAPVMPFTVTGAANEGDVDYGTGLPFKFVQRDDDKIEIETSSGFRAVFDKGASEEEVNDVIAAVWDENPDDFGENDEAQLREGLKYKTDPEFAKQVDARVNGAKSAQTATPADAVLSAAKPATDSPAAARPTAAQIAQQQATASPAEQPAATFPTLAQVLEFAKKNASNVYKKIEAVRGKGLDQAESIVNELLGQIAAYMAANKMAESRMDANMKLSSDANLNRQVRSYAKQIAASPAEKVSAKLGSLFNFLDNFVEKEDFDKALARVEKILGKDFNFEFLPAGKRVWDKVRGAQVYVFGECAASGLRLYRDASTNKIARGSFYHEAFHRISLFVLSKDERRKMYEEARDTNLDLIGATDQQLDEILADRFAEFVLASQQEGVDKFYSENRFVRFFEKIMDAIRNIVRKLSGKQLTPGYKNMGKLFKDMYSGRFAYAQATKENIEEFQKLYGEAPAYDGFKVNGKTLARDAAQYTDIFRDMLGKLVYNSGLRTDTKGNIVIDVNRLREAYGADIRSYMEAARQLDQVIASKDPGVMQRFSAEDLATRQAQMCRLIAVYQNIIRPENWREWVKIIDRFTTREFNLSARNSNDPNKIAQVNTEEDLQLSEDGGYEMIVDGVDVLGFTEYRDSYMRDMYKAVDVNLKMMLWSITENNKFTADGLLKFANVRDLYTRLVHEIANSNSVEDMLSKLALAAKQQKDEEGSDTLSKVLDTLLDPSTNRAFVNKFFTDFVRYIHNFETHSYETKGNDPDNPRYDGATKAGNVEANLSTIQSKWKRGMNDAFGRISDTLRNLSSSSDRTKYLREARKDLQEAMKNLKLEDIESIKAVLVQSENLYGFGEITGDLNQDALIWQRAMKAAKTDKLKGERELLTPLVRFNSLTVSDFTTDSQNKTYKVGTALLLQNEFKAKGGLRRLAQQFGDFANNMPSTQSQKGPRNVKIYAIGSHNFITRTFTTLAKTKEWVSKMMNNVYNGHSLWLDFLSKSPAKVNTKLSTVLDDNYDDAVGDKEVTPLEEFMNRFLTIWSGKHCIPSLANKRYAAEIERIPMMKNIIDSYGNINSKVIDTFVGYIADELLAVSDALYTRQYFVDQLNKVLHTKYTVDSFSKLSGLEQEEIFKNNREAAALLKLLINTYHFKAKNQTVGYDENNKRFYKRAFHIDLREGEGYKFRHFANMMKNFNISKEIIDELSKPSEDLSKGIFSTTRRTEAIKNAYDRVNSYTLLDDKGNPMMVEMLVNDAIQKRPLTLRMAVDNMLRRNIHESFEALGKMGAIAYGEKGLTNLYLPENAVKSYLGKTDQKYIDETMLHNAIGSATIQFMSDMIEFEKVCSGDKAYHKDETARGKRYSGVVSTTSITSERGTILSAFEEDTLFDSPTYRAINLNTTIVVNKAKFAGELLRNVGLPEDAVQISANKKGKFVATIDHKLLLENGKIREDLANKPLVARFLNFRKEGKVGFEGLTDNALAKKIIDTFNDRYTGYLNNDPTDAQSWITSAMFRQLKQRKGLWNDVMEACHNLLQYYNRFGNEYFVTGATSRSLAIVNMCKTLDIDIKELVSRAKAYDEAVKTKGINSTEAKDYRGWIINKVSDYGFEAPSLKYIYYGYEAGRRDNLTAPIYDKSSYVTLYGIVTAGHDMDKVRRFLEENNIHVMKMESATKSACNPCFELYDKNGNIDINALQASVVNDQYFNLLGEQLNTESHHTNSASLLTQFMKVAMMNTNDNNIYNVGNANLTGKQLKTLYKSILDTLTRRGIKRFTDKWGIKGNTIDKAKFMHELQKMAQTENLPAETIAAFATDADGNFIIHPAAMPNIAWVISRLISQMSDEVIDTVTPGKALYLATSVGFDNVLDVKSSADPHLLMPGELDSNGKTGTRMQVRLSIGFFADIIKMAKQEGVKGYDLDNFEGQKKFILDNKELFALSYRVPTQGQNSTIPIDIVDLIADVNGSVIQFPAGITALTGSDFDIDKMFLARYNYEIKDGKLSKISYKTPVSNFASTVNSKISSMGDVELQNMLLDIYQGVLTSDAHILAATTPLDVCTGPVSDFAKVTLPEMRGDSEDQQEVWDGKYLSPAFQVEQKRLNSSSDEGIGPMALNSVFQFIVQSSGLHLRTNKLLKELGINTIGKTFDKEGNEILDSTSGLINAFVDAAKDNYIGNAGVNDYTYDVTSLLIAAGFGNDTFSFLSQPIVREIAQNYMNYKKGMIGVTAEERSGAYYRTAALDHYMDAKPSDKTFDSANLMSHDELLGNLREDWGNPDWVAKQIQYAKIFAQIYSLAQDYHDAIACAQIDTKKFGTSMPQLIQFLQKVDSFDSEYNITFDNPDVMFSNTFLGEKFIHGVQDIFSVFKSSIVEFSDVYRGAIDTLSKQLGQYGKSKELVRVAGPKIKTVLFTPFFNTYITERFGTAKPLAKLMFGADSVPGRFAHIKTKAIMQDVGTDLFSVLSYSSNNPDVKVAQFIRVSPALKENPDLKNNVQLALVELLNSDDQEIRQWANDFLVYMFYASGGTDSNAGGVVRTTLYDIIPPQYLANLKAGNMTFNQYVNQVMQGVLFGQTELDHVMRLLALTDDQFIKTIDPKKGITSIDIIKKGSSTNVFYVTRGSQRLRNYSTGQFDRFVKVSVPGGYDLYQLGAVTVTKGKKGTFTNPVYFKVNRLGYRSNSIKSYVLRADGAYEGGKIKSLYNNDFSFTATNYAELDEAGKKTFNRMKFEKIYTVEEFNDYSDRYVMDSDKPDNLRAAIDSADAVVYLSDSDALKYASGRNYAQFKNKPFYVVNSNDGEVKVSGDKIAVIGDDTDAISNIKAKASAVYYTTAEKMAAAFAYDGKTVAPSVGKEEVKSTDEAREEASKAGEDLKKNC